MEMSGRAVANTRTDPPPRRGWRHKLGYWRLLLRLQTIPRGRSTGAPAVGGYLSTTIGLGDGARLILRAFREQGWRPAAFDVSGRVLPGRAGRVDFGAGAPDDGHGPLVLHVNPPEVPLALLAIPRSVLAGRRRIGIWTWELSEAPKSWAPLANWFDEIWTPSPFVSAAIEPLAPGRVRTVGYPFWGAPDTPDARARGRALMGIDNDTFVAGVNADARSSLERKNPAGAIAAFRRAFPDRPDALLVVKLVNGGERVLASAAEGDPRVRFITSEWDDSEMAAWRASLDVTIALSRSEGFGLGPAQGLAAGVPAIVTAGTAMDFYADNPAVTRVDASTVPVRDPFGLYKVAGQTWAEPDLDMAASALRELAGMDRAARFELGEVGRKAFLQAHGAPAFLNRLSPFFYEGIGRPAPAG